MEGDLSEMSVGGADVAEQQERDEGQPGEGQEEGEEGAGPGGSRPLGEPRQGPAQQVTQVEDKESSHRNKIFLPALVRGDSGNKNISSASALTLLLLVVSARLNHVGKMARVTRKLRKAARWRSQVRLMTLLKLICLAGSGLLEVGWTWSSA